MLKRPVDPPGRRADLFLPLHILLTFVIFPSTPSPHSIFRLPSLSSVCFALRAWVPAACSAVKGPARSATGNYPLLCLPLTALPPAGMGQPTGQRGTAALRPAYFTCAKPLFRRKSMDFRKMDKKHRLCGLPALRKSMDYREMDENHRLCGLPVLRKSMDFGETVGNHRLWFFSALGKSMDFGETAGNHRLCVFGLGKVDGFWGNGWKSSTLCFLALKKSMDFGETAGNHRLFLVLARSSTRSYSVFVFWRDFSFLTRNVQQVGE